jgi:SAM-dependent methyltransferase
VDIWSIQPGARVLEIGCGQGNCTAVLAYTIGPTGHIDAVDPAPGDYGRPFTLDQSQAYLSASEIGEQITWHRAEPQQFIASTSDTWDVAVLAHCIWYFKSTDVLRDILVALRGRVKSICIAEYALSATEAHAVPHVLAAIARGSLEAHLDVSQENIRSLLSPDAIEQVARTEGWVVKRSQLVVPGARLGDGEWETAAVVGEDFVEEIETSSIDEAVKVVLRSMRQAVLAASKSVKGSGRVRTMDVWVAELVEAE